MLECVVNVSEGRDASVLRALRLAAGYHLLDEHSDPDHNRSVLTLAGPHVQHAAERVVSEAVARIDLRAHRGSHPRLGAVDVVPFTPLEGSSFEDALAARDRFARWAAESLGLPCFVFGPERSLPEIRRDAFTSLAPTTGPDRPHPSAGALSVGARGVLVAYNLWLGPGSDVQLARKVAAAIRGPGIRALGLDLDGLAQVSCNLIEPLSVGPHAAYDAVEEHVAIARAELVGLVPARVLDAIPPSRWRTLDLSPSRTIEARLQKAGLDVAGRGGQ
ncbi:MAG: glutamate formiminotransferase [Actinomycetota bacterium]|nr:glutamate formiminotransferase [Actinomycetota bacterium]